VFRIKYRIHREGTTGAANTGSTGWLIRWLLIGCIVLGYFLGGACTNGGVSQPQANPGQTTGEAAETPGSASPVSPTPPVEPPSPPPIPSAPDQSDQSSSQPPQNSVPPIAGSFDSTTLITRQAATMTLTLADMGTGWAQINANAPSIQQVNSSSHVSYSQGSSYAPGVQNTVAVYRTITAAEEAFAREKQTNPSASSAGIGDESLLNNSVPINKLLVFRKNNVVVWLWLKQYKEGDIERYARIVEQKIAAAASPATAPEQPTPAVSPPPQQVPAESPAGIQSGITKSTDGLVTKQAYEMVLTAEDMGSGWMRGNVSPPANRKSSSSSTVSYSQGSSYAPTVQNTVAVYRDMAAATDAYAAAKPSGASLTYPSIGNECFLNNSVTIDRLLVFRKDNVVVWLWLKQYKTGDMEGYARTVEKKITF